MDICEILKKLNKKLSGYHAYCRWNSDQNYTINRMLFVENMLKARHIHIVTWKVLLEITFLNIYMYFNHEI